MSFRRRIVLLGVAPLLAMAAPGAPAVRAAQNPAPEAAVADAGIVVQGVGEVSATPDIARITLGVETRNAEAAKASEENATRTDAVIKAIRAAGVAEKDVQTSGYNLFRTEEIVPRGGAPDAQRDRRVVYVATNTVRVTVRKVADAGKVIDAAVKAGANVAGGVEFDFANPKPLEDEALGLAMADAVRKVKVLGRAAGYTRLEFRSVVEQGAAVPRPMYGGVAMMAERADMATPTPVQPGEQKVTARVTVRYVPAVRMVGPGVVDVAR